MIERTLTIVVQVVIAWLFLLRTDKVVEAIRNPDDSETFGWKRSWTQYSVTKFTVRALGAVMLLLALRTAYHALTAG